MAASTTAPTAGARTTDLTGVVLLVVAAAQFLPGVLAAVAPGAFYDLLGSYPPQNDHFIRDLGSWQIGLGIVAFAAALRPALRPPVLIALAVQYAVHAISHVIDVDGAERAGQGPGALVLQLLGVAVLTTLAIKEHRR